MPSSTTELIKQKLDVVTYIREHLELQPAGKNFKARCPFHKEKTPSFMVSPERQSWHCFGCGLGGDIFTFAMRHEGIEFNEALRLLAEKTGVELRRLNPQEYKITGLLYEINDEANRFYRESLAKSAPAEEYLKKRGLTKETIGIYEVGWAPQGTDILSLHLIKRGYRPEDIERAGLAFKSERGLYVDRFRGRIMFPIHNHYGKTVGFTGRLLPQFDTGSAGKYVNSAESPIFNKSRLFYGLWNTKGAIRDSGAALIVEGQMDFLMAWQAGIKNVVASSGTALTQEHLLALKRLADELIISFDADEAGAAAGERAIDVAEANDFNVRVLVLSDAKDPAEAVEKNPAGFARAVRNARTAMDFYIHRYLGEFMASGTAISPADRRNRRFINNLRVVLGKLKNMASTVARSSWLKELSDKTGVSETILAEEMDTLLAPSAARASINETQSEDSTALLSPITRRELLSRHLLATAVRTAEWDAFAGSLPHLTIGYAEAFDALKRGERTSRDSRIDEIMNMAILLSGDARQEDGATLMKYLKMEYDKEKKTALAAAIKRAETAGDEKTLESSLKEFQAHLKND